MKKIFIFGMLTLLMLATSCADVAQVQFTNPHEHIYGFWGGTWHGMITTISFIGSCFSDDIAIYAVHNNGFWYDFGFIGGLWISIKAIRVLFIILANIINGSRR